MPLKHHYVCVRALMRACLRECARVYACACMLLYGNKLMTGVYFLYKTAAYNL